MIDPDAPVTKNTPGKSWLHWLLDDIWVTNLEILFFHFVVQYYF